MAAGTLPEPGTEYGPCLEACAHRDCASTREMAEAVCSGCGEPIGYGRSYYRDRPELVDDETTVLEDGAGNTFVLIHARCLDELLEAGSA